VAAESGGIDQQRREPLHPPQHGDVVDVDAALGEQLLDVAVGQAVLQVPSGPPPRSPRPGTGTREGGPETRDETE
jgi:hypothetical protein